jgi:hypothetical protein
MCAPCKVVVNEQSQQSAQTGSTIRELILHPPPKVEPGTPEDDLMFQLAEYEVRYIKATRRAAVDYAKMIGAPQRWIDLLEALV